MLEIIQSVLKIIASWVGYKTDPKTIKKAEDKALDESVAKTNVAIQKGDTDKVNSDIDNILKGKSMIILIFLICISSTGCLHTTKIQPVRYIPIEQKAVPIPADSVIIKRAILEDVLHKGKVLTEADVVNYTIVDGWFVPNSVFTILMEKSARWNDSQKNK